ncbi:MAG TPA: LuxR C-terminal-related transcriptional regulator, partial [Ktedonobacteraceae bacterium]|nr:LuxR C-terminal-related transcriptional regulator [Ktedonobacteraceae bacterium]
ATQTFLLHTALLERCNASLCAAVTGQEQAARLLEELACAQIFLSPLVEQEGWYRYHPLFASALRQHLRRTQPELAIMLHRRASQWLEAHNLLTEAVEHALAAHEYTHVATLIEKIAPALISEGKIPVLQNWLDALPETVVRSSPRLCISRVWLIFITSRPDTFILWVEAAQEALHRLEETLPPPTLVALQSEILALRSVYTISFADFSESIATCQQALQQLPTESHYLRGLILMLLGFAYTRSTDVGAAARALSEASSNIRVTGHALLLPYVIGAQAELYMAQGYPFQAAQLYRYILTLATEQNLSSLFAAGTAHLGLGYLLWEWNNLAESEYHLLQAWHMAQRTQTGTTLFQGALLLALVARAQGDSAATQFWQQQVESLSHQRNYAEVAGTIAAVRAGFALKEGRLEETMLWVREQSQRNTDSGYKRDEFIDFTLARALIAAGQAGIEASAGIRVCEPLEYWRISANQAGRVRVLLEALVLQALVLQDQGDRTGALHALQRAVTLAEPGRYIRLFVDEGDPMARLLRQLLEQQRAQNASDRPNNVAYLCILLKAFAQPGTFALPISPTKEQPLFNPLSLREREVLNLIAAGRKNREIADELVVVTGTVKAHINMIYQKLGVTNRVQAITRARSLGLLP